MHSASVEDLEITKLLKRDLKSSHATRVFCLRSWGLELDRVNVLWSFLTTDTRLHTLKLVSCRLGEGVGEKLIRLPSKYATFEKFKLSNLTASPSEFGLLLALAQRCPKLHTFILRNHETALQHDLVTQSLFEIVAKPSLTMLCIQSCNDLNRIFVDLTKVLAEKDILSVLRLTSANLSGIFTEHASSFLFKPSLTKLDLWNTALGDTDLALITTAIATNPNLLKVNLSKNAFSPKGLTLLWDVMDANMSVQSLKIDVCAGDIASFKRLHAILSTNTTLSTFSLKIRGGQYVESDTLRTSLCGFLVGALFSNTTLRKLSIEHQQWHDQLRTLTKLILTNQILRKISVRIYDPVSYDLVTLMNSLQLNGSLLEPPYFYNGTSTQHDVDLRNERLYARKHITFTELLLRTPSRSAKRQQIQ